jgi:hypothetical protein
MVSVCRTGAGGIRCIFRIRRIVEVPMRWPSFEQFALVVNRFRVLTATRPPAEADGPVEE